MRGFREGATCYGAAMYDLLETMGPEIRAFAARAADRYVGDNPRGFELYSVLLDEDALRSLVSDWDLSEQWDWLVDEVKGYAVARLRELEAEGKIGAVTAGANSLEWRGAARGSEHPLLRIMADAEFGGALAAEVASALREAESLSGWDPERPQILRASI